MTLLVGSIFHMTRKIVSEMTYNVSMGTLNPTIPILSTGKWEFFVTVTTYSISTLLHTEILPSVTLWVHNVRKRGAPFLWVSAPRVFESGYTALQCIYKLCRRPPTRTRPYHSWSPHLSNQIYIPVRHCHLTQSHNNNMPEPRSGACALCTSWIFASNTSVNTSTGGLDVGVTTVCLPVKNKILLDTQLSFNIVGLLLQEYSQTMLHSSRNTTRTHITQSVILHNCTQLYLIDDNERDE